MSFIVHRWRLLHIASRPSPVPEVRLLLPAGVCSKRPAGRPVLGLLLGGRRRRARTRLPGSHVYSHVNDTQFRYATDITARLLRQGDRRVDGCVPGVCVCGVD